MRMCEDIQDRKATGNAIGPTIMRTRAIISQYFMTDSNTCEMKPEIPTAFQQQQRFENLTYLPILVSTAAPIFVLPWIFPPIFTVSDNLSRSLPNNRCPGALSVTDHVTLTAKLLQVAKASLRKRKISSAGSLQILQVSRPFGTLKCGTIRDSKDTVHHEHNECHKSEWV